jgi:hypothetical protein
MDMNKPFDCVEMKHQGSDRIRQETKNMSVDEEIRYWKEKPRNLPNKKNYWETNIELLCKNTFHRTRG